MFEGGRSPTHFERVQVNIVGNEAFVEAKDDRLLANCTQIKQLTRLTHPPLLLTSASPKGCARPHCSADCLLRIRLRDDALLSCAASRCCKGTCKDCHVFHGMCV